MKEILYYEGGKALAQAAQRSCAPSLEQFKVRLDRDLSSLV